VTTFYFSQLYQTLGNQEKYAFYCQSTLQRQLKEKDALDRKEWTRNALSLSEYYASIKRYRQAIHCMEAACKIAPEFNPDDDDDQQLRADIDKEWGKLYLSILQDSFNVMSNEEHSVITANATATANISNKVDNNNNDKKNEEKNEEVKKPETKDNNEIKDDKNNTNNANSSNVNQIALEADSLLKLDKKLQLDNSLTLFANIKTKTPPEMHLGSTFDECKELFVPGLKHLMNALNYYVLDGFVTDHVSIAQDVSKLYQYLAFFEKDVNNKCKMHKMRINLLKEIEKQLSPQAYADIVQLLCHEIGIAYDEIANLRKK